jgi:hypothetical protein
MKKEANLITSPVLREFYNTAVQKEWIAEDKLSKSASTSIDKYAATGNFMQDLVNLASGLRELGLYEQAESLEVKLNIFKKAQLAFSNLIDEQSRALQQAAHAESTKIVDAQGGWGVVHTNMDRQQKILETLTHQPGTGSPAPVMNNLVMAAAEALGLLKIAQGEVEGASDLEEVSADLSEEDRMWDVTATAQQKQNAKDINKKILELKSKFQKNSELAQQTITASRINALLPSSLSNIGENNEALNLYAKATNQDASELSSFFSKYSAVTTAVGGALTADSIASKINEVGGGGNKDKSKYDALLSWSQQFNIAGFSADSYFKGSVIDDADLQDKDVIAALNNEARSDSRYKSNPNSVWLLDAGLVHGNWGTRSQAEYTIGMDDHVLNASAVNAVAENLAKIYNDLYNKYFTSKIETLKAEVLSLLTDQILTPYLAVNSKIQEIQDEVKSTAIPVVNKLNEASSDLRQIAKTFTKTLSKDSRVLLIRAQAENTWNSLSLAIAGDGDIQAAINYILDRPLRSKDKSDRSQLLEVINSLNKSLKIYGQYSASLGEKDSNKSSSIETIRQIGQAISKLSKAYKDGGTLEQIRESLGNAEIKDLSLIKSEADSALEQAKSFTGLKEQDLDQISDGIFSKEANLKKIANILGINAPGAKPAKPGSARPAGGSSGAKLTQPVELTETKKAVYNMQWALGKLGDYLMATGDTSKMSDASTIMIIGKTGGAISDPEGVWGANTAKSLKTAKKYVTTISEFGPIKAFNNDQDKIKSAAEKNYELITSFLQGKGFSLTGAPGRVNVVFDKISEILDLTNFNQDGEVPVTQNDLVNLKNFSNFVRSKVNSFPFDIATAEDWLQLIVWFSGRAGTKVTTADSLPAKGLARSYLRYVQALSQAFMRKMESNGIQINTSDWSTLQLKDTLSEGGDLGDQAGGLGAGAGARGPGGRVGGAGFGPSSAAGGPEGAGTSTVERASGQRTYIPFDAETVYLSSLDKSGRPWFNLSGYGLRTLDKGTVLASPIVAGKASFPTESWNEQQVLTYYIENFVPRGTWRNEPGLGASIKDPRTGDWMPIQSTPDYRRLREEISNIPSMQRYGEFLTELFSQLTDAKNRAIDFIQNSGESNDKIQRQIRTLNSYHNEWVRLIQRQFSKIPK